MRSLTNAVVFAALATLTSCTPDAQREEGALIDTRDNVLEQGIVDCSESTDTGYSQGNPFPITVVTVDGKPVELQTANAYVVMQGAAAFGGVGIRIVSGFRTMGQQEYLYGCYVNCNCNSCNLAASPGYSNHQSGHALDLNTSDPGVLDWLNNYGAEYGFARTVPSEPWHWEWWGGGPGGGPCGADLECIFDPNFGGCNGSVITHCDQYNHVSTGDCGFFGAACSVEGGHPHCVHPYCTINLGGETGSFCVDGTNVVATCNLGQYSEGDCGFFGCTCSEEGGQGHCVHPFCPANLDGGETGNFCVDGTRIGTCNLGQYEEGDCGFFGATCSEGGGAAHCVHFMCWSNLEGREDGTLCVDDNTLGSCALGAYAESECALGCVEPADGAGNAHCVDERCASFVDATGSQCVDGATLATCTRGAYAEASCGDDGCATDGAGARCVGEDDAGTASEPDGGGGGDDDDDDGDDDDDDGDDDANGGDAGTDGSDLPPSTSGGCASAPAPLAWAVLALWWRRRRTR